LELLDELIEDRRDTARRASGRIGMGDDGRIFLIEAAPELASRDADLLQRIRDWAAANCDLVPALGGAAAKLRQQRLSTLLGHAFYDILLAAEGEDRAILSEDLWFRMLAHEVSGTKGSWLQPILMAATKAGSISPEGYLSAIINLIKSRHWFTSIDAGNLFADLVRDNYEPFPTMFEVARILGRPDVDWLGVTMEFIAQIWAAPLALHQKEKITFAILRALTENQPRRAADVARRIYDRSDFMTRGRRVRAAVKDWCAGHFLPAPDLQPS
jgi:hypothetical protein